MSSTKNKKRSFRTFESNQKNVFDSKKKKHKKNNYQKKNKNMNRDYFDIGYKSCLDSFEVDDIDKLHCLEFHNLLSFLTENHLYGIIKHALNEWYKMKKEKKLEIKTDGKFDIHLIHNRHNSGIEGFAFIYFENKSDASYILQLSKQKKLKMQKNNHLINCQWKQNSKDEYSSIYQTDITLKGSSNIIKISNLHWKTTLFHLYQLFNSSILNDDESENENEKKRDLDPRWIRIMEDKNGFPKCQALIMLNNPQNVIYCIDKLTTTNYKLFGRKLKFEYSSYQHQGELLTKYDENNLQLAGYTKKLLLKNIKQSVKTSDIVKFLKKYIGDNDNEYEEIVNDVYLIHNLNKVCGGKCFITFNNVENAQKYFDILQWKQLCHRTIIVEYGHIHNQFEQENFNINNIEKLKGKTNRLFITNLSWDVKEKDIYRFFGNKVKINEIYFNVTSNGYPKGSAFITFESNEIALKAYNKSNGKKLRHRQIRLDFAECLPFVNNNQNYNDY